MDVFIQIATMVKISDSLSLSSRTHLLKICRCRIHVVQKGKKSVQTNYHVASGAVINQMDCYSFQDPVVPISHLIFADDVEFAQNFNFEFYFSRV